MATNIKFGLDIPDVDLNKVSSGGFGNSSNSTSSSNVAPADTKIDKPKQTTKDQLDIVSRDQGLNFSAPSTGAVNNVVDTDQLESSSGAGFALPPSFTPERISVGSPEPVDVEGKEKKIAEAQAQIKILKSEKEAAGMRDDVKAGFDSIGNIGAFEADLIEDKELQRKEALKIKYDNELLSKNREIDLAIRDAQDEFGTRAQKNAIKSEIINKGNRALADIAIKQMAAAGDYNSARSYVDEKVRLELQDRKAELDKLIFLYQENKERFSKEEQRAFEKKIKEEERTYSEDYDERKKLEDMKLSMTINATEAGAGNGTLQAIQNAQDTTSLLSLPNAGTYTKSKADRLSEQLQSINIAKANKELNAVTSNLVSSGISPITGKPYNQFQGDSAGFALRMEDSKTVLDGGKGLFIPGVPGFAKSAERRQFEQAEQNFITAQLRKESGASISDEEFIRAREVYIPIATDDQVTLENKRLARETVIQNQILQSAGMFNELKSTRIDPRDGELDEHLDRATQEVDNPYEEAGYNKRN